MHLGKEAIDFAYFRSLGEEVAKLLSEEGLGTEILADEDNWVSLISTLVKVLEGQPLNIKASHGLNIKSITFMPSAPGCVIMRVDFNEPVASKDGTEYPFYTLKNAF